MIADHKFSTPLGIAPPAPAQSPLLPTGLILDYICAVSCPSSGFPPSALPAEAFQAVSSLIGHSLPHVITRGPTSSPLPPAHSFRNIFSFPPLYPPALGGSPFRSPRSPSAGCFPRSDSPAQSVRTSLSLHTRRSVAPPSVLSIVSPRNPISTFSPISYFSWLSIFFFGAPELSTSRTLLHPPATRLLQRLRPPQIHVHISIYGHPAQHGYYGVYWPPEKNLELEFPS